MKDILGNALEIILPVLSILAVIWCILYIASPFMATQSKLDYCQHYRGPDIEIAQECHTIIMENLKK